MRQREAAERAKQALVAEKTKEGLPTNIATAQQSDHLAMVAAYNTWTTLSSQVCTLLKMPAYLVFPLIRNSCTLICCIGNGKLLLHHSCTFNLVICKRLLLSLKCCLLHASLCLVHYTHMKCVVAKDMVNLEVSPDSTCNVQTNRCEVGGVEVVKVL